MRAEVDTLVKVRFIREVAYPEWLANPILIKKSNGKYMMLQT